MTENREWSWVGKDGIEHAVSEDELTFALSSEELAPHTLVCHQGWHEWLPAMQVAELAWALPPGYADAPQKPNTSENGARKPPPLDRYSEFERRAADIKSGRINPALESVSSLTGVGTSIPPSSGHRDHLPTIADDDLDELTVALGGDQARELIAAAEELSAPRAQIPSPPPPAPRPARRSPQVEPPAPRQRARLAAERVSQDRVTANLGELAPHAVELEPDAVELEPDAVELEPDAVELEPDAVELEAEAVEQHANAGLPPRIDSAPVARPVPSARASGFAEPNSQSLAPSPKRANKLGVWAATLGLIAAGGAAAVWFVSYRGTADDTAGAAASASLAPVTASEQAIEPPNCKVSAGPTRVGEWAQPKIRPFMRVVSSGVAVGFGKTSRYALGLTLNPENLEVSAPFSDYATSPIASVVPMEVNGQVEFAVSRAASTLQSQLMLEASPPFPVGMTQDGFASRTGSVDEVLWSTDFDHISIPSVVRMNDGTFVVAFRSGGGRGNISMGVITPNGKAKGDLHAVDNSASRVGVPAVTTDGQRLLVAFDSGPKHHPNGLFVGVSRAPAMPASAKSVLESEDGAASPTAIGLARDHVLLQWTRGAPGRQNVVAQVYSPQLVPASPEISVSPTAKDAHSGVVIGTGSGALSVYMVRNGENHELWASTLTCR